MSEQHPDPFTEGLTFSGQRITQFVAIAAAGRQLHKQLRQRLRDARHAKEEAALKRTEALRKAALEEARARWSPAHDREWLRTANLVEVGQAWAAALPYANELTSAGSAVGKCEDRLRELHPYGMERYDRLRDDGTDRLAAMKEAAPFFNHAPHTRTGHAPVSRPALTEGDGTTWAANPHGPSRSEMEEAVRRERARQIAADLRSRCKARGHDPSPIELRTMLEITTNLPEEVIAEAVPVRAASSSSGIATSEGALADEGFPLTIDEALTAPSTWSAHQSSARRTPVQVPDRNRRRNL
ncbi:hypothetical protein GCM10009678_66490 [Actinomadura kijaniata]|uniref:Uncharacterized protein n=1 Tax=Actinomadura namibiensis TaxID=182080 RepID=A0A7W3LY80_ACTNM|nr:hypothetical protein [Actinomadura namibiensis]MBA8956551.1 hypothetical protein [Actinomadura namibiensis]